MFRSPPQKGLLKSLLLFTETSPLFSFAVFVIRVDNVFSFELLNLDLIWLVGVLEGATEIEG